MTDFNEKNVIARIIQLRKKFAGPRGKSKFANAIGISPSTYNYYEEDRLPSIPLLLKICRVTDADLHWLITGQTQAGPQIDSQLYTKINNLLEASPTSKPPLLAFIDLLAENKNAQHSLRSKSPQPSTNRPGWIPILGRTAAGIVHFCSETTLPDPKKRL